MDSSDDMAKGVIDTDSTQNIADNEVISTNENSENVKTGKEPRRVLHFSDGVLEEYSTDDENEEDKPDSSKAVDTKRMTWPRYLLYATMAFGNGTLKVCDYLGEGLASFLGITTPKYQYEINEYERMVKEQEEAKKKEDVEMRGWHESNANGEGPVSTGPTAAVSTEAETQQRY